jgi:hypothetical protein
MNERIDKLLVKAGAYFGGEGVVYDSFDPKKFAELIVQECISINRQRLFSDYEGDSLRVAHNNALLCATSDMFEHFGVGE